MFSQCCVVGCASDDTDGGVEAQGATVGAEGQWAVRQCWAQIQTPRVMLRCSASQLAAELVRGCLTICK